MLLENIFQIPEKEKPPLFFRMDKYAIFDLCTIIYKT